MKKKKENPFDTQDFKEAHAFLCVEGWDNWLKGEGFPKPPKEIFFCQSNEEEVKYLISEFEKRFNRKLKYRIMGLTYISYLETVVGEKYEK